MPELPGGTVTFVMTDIEGSARLWEQHPDQMRTALARHDALTANAVDLNDGTLVKSRGEGDSLFAVFAMASNAVSAALALQQALVAEAWPAETPLRVRMALHTGEADLRDGDYYGPTVNRCARLRAIGHGGQVLVSESTSALVRDALPHGSSLRDAGEQRLRDLARPEHVFELLHVSLPSGFPPLRSLNVLPNNLPHQLTSFIGREREMAEVTRLLGTTRLLTLTGPGGCGKSRLALQTAAEVLEDYPDGVWIVELAPLSDASLVPQTVASALRVKEAAGCPAQQSLVSYLEQKSLLLVLDNCEHLLSGSAGLTDGLLRACPNLRILATSREGMGITGETTFQVPSLSLPKSGSRASVERVSQCEAVRLFIDRAVAAVPGFAVTNQNAPAVASVCDRLDGIPLAIELAAARVRALSVEQIAARLDDRFHLLTGGSRTALPRQQTLRALIDWSYDLLTPPEQTLLRRLCVFTGGWTLPAAESVCSGDGIDQWQVMDLLTELVDKSLVLFQQGNEGAGRYRLLETVRQYGREKAEGACEHERLRGLHVDCFLAMVEHAQSELSSPNPIPCLERLEAEHANLRQALDYAAGKESEARLAAALWRFWMYHSHFEEGNRALTTALDRYPDAPRSVRADLLTGAGTMAWLMSEFSRASALHLEALKLYGQVGDRRNMAFALNNIAAQMCELREDDRARVLLEECLALYKDIGDELGARIPRINLGMLALQADDLDRAADLCEEALKDARLHDSKWDTLCTLHNLAEVANRKGEYAKARRMYRESLQLSLEIGDTRIVALDLEGIGWVAQGCGDLERAAMLFGKGDALRRALNSPVPPREKALYEPVIAAMQTHLGGDGLARAWERGSAMSLDEAVAFAREEWLGRAISAEGAVELGSHLIEESAD